MYRNHYKGPLFLKKNLPTPSSAYGPESQKVPYRLWVSWRSAWQTRNCVDLRGSLTVTLSQKQHKCDQEIFLNLLGLPTIKGFHLLSVLDNLECDPTTAIKQVYLQGQEHSKVIMISRSSQMLSLSHLALLETSHYLFVIRWNKNWMWWKLKELYQRYNSLLPGALAWWLWRRRTEEWEFASIWSHSIDAYLENTTLCESQWHPWTTDRSHCVLQAGCKQWVLAGAISWKILAVYHFHYPIRKVQLQ